MLRQSLSRGQQPKQDMHMHCGTEAHDVVGVLYDFLCESPRESGRISSDDTHSTGSS